MIKKLLKYLILLALVIYGAICYLVYEKPQYFFYNPGVEASNLDNAVANGYKAKVVNYKSSDGTELYAWMTKPGKQKKMIIFMHGNSYNIEKFYHKMIPFVEAGYGTMIPEYRGFADIKGEITQKNLGNDAIAAVKYLNSIGYKNSDIIVYGMSLGSYMATNSVYQLQKNGRFAALVLEVPFDSLLNTAKAVVPVKLPFEYIMKDHYDNAAMIDKINTKVLIMGGSDDPTIPVSLAKNLFAQAANPKKLIIYRGGKHSDLYNFRNYRDILNWLKTGK